MLNLHQQIRQWLVLCVNSINWWRTFKTAEKKLRSWGKLLLLGCQDLIWQFCNALATDMYGRFFSHEAFEGSWSGSLRSIPITVICYWITERAILGLRGEKSSLGAGRMVLFNLRCIFEGSIWLECRCIWIGHCRCWEYAAWWHTSWKFDSHRLYLAEFECNSWLRLPCSQVIYTTYLPPRPLQKVQFELQFEPVLGKA